MAGGSTISPRVALFARYPLDAAAGNAVAARALIEGLGRRGLTTTFVGPTDRFEDAVGEVCVCHALHAGASATEAARCAEARGARLVVTVTGTDLEDWTDEVEGNLARADAIVAIAAPQVEALRVRGHGGRVVKIPQGLDLDEIERARAQADRALLGDLAGSERVALLLAGLRPVKDVGLALDAIGRAPGWRLVVAGDVLDEGYARGLHERAGSLDTVTIRAAYSRQDALRAMAAADAVLNTSKSEGASRTILEAQALGAAVLARDIEGNRALIADGRDGLVFRGVDGLVELLGRDNAALEPLRAGARGRAADRPNLEDELDRHVELYGAAR